MTKDSPRVDIHSFTKATLILLTIKQFSLIYLFLLPSLCYTCIISTLDLVDVCDCIWKSKINLHTPTWMCMLLCESGRCSWDEPTVDTAFTTKLTKQHLTHRKKKKILYMPHNSKTSSTFKYSIFLHKCMPYIDSLPISSLPIPEQSNFCPSVTPSVRHFWRWFQKWRYVRLQPI